MENSEQMGTLIEWLLESPLRSVSEISHSPLRGGRFIVTVREFVSYDATRGARYLNYLAEGQSCGAAADGAVRQARQDAKVKSMVAA